MARKFVWMVIVLVMSFGWVFLFTHSVSSAKAELHLREDAVLVNHGFQEGLSLEIMPVSPDNWRQDQRNDASADLAITMDVEPSLAARLDTITYTLVFTNYGPGTATNLVISDTFHPMYYYMSYFATLPLNPVGFPTTNFLLETLAPGQSGQLTIILYTLSDPKGVYPITNTAHIYSSIPDPNPVNNLASVFHTLDADPPTGSNPVEPAFGARVTQPWVTFTWTETGSLDYEGYILFYRVDFKDNYSFDAGKSLSATIPVPEGLVDWMVWPYDRAGNLGKDGQESIFIHDSTPPTIVSAVPRADAENVAVSQTIVITFSEFVDVNTAMITVTPDPGNLQKTWSPDSKIVTISHNDFKLSTKYNIHVWVEDRGKLPINPLGSTWSFATRFFLFLPLARR